ncbi:MAG: hypothetical protein H0X02_13115 [Nitrosomonas sp.]|nr:hypothetical protein [Nitrosomonas sp.]
METDHSAFIPREKITLNFESHLRTTEALGKFSARCSLHTFSVLLVVFFIALLFHFDLAPLEETHWDAPIYVQLSKRAAETNMLADYHQYAHEIQLGPGDDAHWYFTRIGHILLLGEVTRLFGTTETALVAMQWLYRIFMAFGVTLCIVLGLRLVTLLRSEEPDSIWKAGYLLAAVTYVASDSYRGLQGHLLSEPPAFVTLALFTVMLLKAVERRSLVIGAFAGCLLFLLFFIRIDAVLPGIVFLAVLLAVLVMLRKFDTIPIVIAAGLVSLVSYLVYAWWFSPLVNPQTLANFSSAAKEMFPGVSVKSLLAIVIAGGLLWVGACAAVTILWRDSVVRFAMIWLGLALLPMVIDSLNGRSVQVRMAFFIVLPLLVLAGEGWSWILRSFIKQQKILPLAIALSSVLILALTPYSLIMQESRNLAINHLPLEIQKYLFISLSKNGAIKPTSPYQDLRLGLLVRPIYERWTLKYSKMQEIGDYLYVPERPAYLLWSGAKLADQHSLQVYIGLIRYFGKKYPENSDILLTKLPNKIFAEPCTARTPSELEPVIFCSTFVSSDLEVLQKKKIPLYILGVDGYPMPEMPQLELRVLLSTPPFVLYGVAE